MARVAHARRARPGAAAGRGIQRRPRLARARPAPTGAAPRSAPAWWRCALVVAVAVVPFAARGAEREVLRSAVGPEIELSAAVSPLAEYRALFDDARADEVLFTVVVRRRAARAGAAGDARRLRRRGLPQRRLRARSTPAGSCGCPATLDAGEGRSVEARDHRRGPRRHLDADRRPASRRSSSPGDRAASLADRFYYSAAAAAGVQTAGGGLEPGDAYVVRGVERPAVDLAAIDAPGGVSEGVAAPDSVRTWVDEHVSGSGGAALAGLVALLRERGYLSHGLSEGDGPAAWMESLPDYTFQPSASGHSLARIDALFGRLLERETDPRAEASGNYVAAVGDDEQFAVAAALIAARARLPGARRPRRPARARPSRSCRTCDDGVCRAQDLAAWTEVQSSDGDWVAVDVTPAVRAVAEPRGHRAARPRERHRGAPRLRRGGRPARSGAGGLRRRTTRADEAAGPDLAWLWPAPAHRGLVLSSSLLAFGPFLVVIGAKAARRRVAPHAAAAPAARIAGGWDEYVDAAVDAGREAPRTLTRSELADGVRDTRPAPSSPRRRTGRCSRRARDRGRGRRGVLAPRRRRASAVRPRARVLARSRRDRIVEIVLPSSGTRRGCPHAFRRKGEAPGC